MEERMTVFDVGRKEGRDACGARPGANGAVGGAQREIGA